MQWPPYDLIAAAASAGTDLAQMLTPVLGVLGVTIAGAFTLVGTFRTSSRAAQTQHAAAQAQRDAQLDERADKQAARLEEENARLRAQLDERTQQRDDYRERWTLLRVGVIAAGLDPDQLTATRGHA